MENNEINALNCRYYVNGYCHLDKNIIKRKCNDDFLFDCYYKQLQAKTAEYEKLKSELEEIEKFCYRGIGNCDGNETECNISLILDFINKAKEQE